MECLEGTRQRKVLGDATCCDEALGLNCIAK